jgi:hypothetical protein
MEILLTELESYLESLNFRNSYDESLDCSIFSNFMDGERYDFIGSFNRRYEVTAKYSFAILTQATIDHLRPYQPFLEVGAGLGYWAYEFKKNGLDIVATDPEPACKDFFPAGAKCWTEIIKMTAIEAIRTYPDRTLLICWPGYTEHWACKLLRAFKGNTVIYVGEGQSGCCATD